MSTLQSGNTYIDKLNVYIKMVFQPKPIVDIIFEIFKSREFDAIINSAYRKYANKILAYHEFAIWL